MDRPEGNEEGDISDDENYVYVKSDDEEENGSHDDNDSTSDST